MQRFNFPTRILFGDGALDELGRELKQRGHKRLLLVTDPGVVHCGLAADVEKRLMVCGLTFETYSEVQPNPVEADVLKGVERYHRGAFDGIVALGGGSPMDAAKAIALLATNPPPLALYDDTKGGDRNVRNAVPPIYAIPTTAGTGSEVGRSAVIVIAGHKTIIFHPDLQPRIAVLAPELTTGLPAPVTAATGMDAFVHCFEAYLTPSFHPMADGIAKEGMALVIEALPVAVRNGQDLEARGKMLMAASMGATAFQKGLGMIHSMAHPLSTQMGMHHGLANALMLAPVTAFLESRQKTYPALRQKCAVVRRLIADAAFPCAGREKLSSVLRRFNDSIGIAGGLAARGVAAAQIEALAAEAVEDPCHGSNAFPVGLKDFLKVYRQAM